MLGTFYVKLTQFEKTGSIRKTLISVGNLIINLYFRNQKSITFFVTVTLLLGNGVCFTLNSGNALNLKKSQVKPRKIKTKREQIFVFKRFLKKKNKVI